MAQGNTAITLICQKTPRDPISPMFSLCLSDVGVRDFRFCDSQCLLGNWRESGIVCKREGCVLGIEPNEHRTPRFQGFSRQTIGFTRQTIGCSRRFMRWFRQSMGCSRRFMCRFRQSMGIICPNHPHDLPKPRCFWLFDGLFPPIAVDGLLFLAGSLPWRDDASPP